MSRQKILNISFFVLMSVCSLVLSACVSNGSAAQSALPSEGSIFTVSVDDNLHRVPVVIGESDARGVYDIETETWNQFVVRVTRNYQFQETVSCQGPFIFGKANFKNLLEAAREEREALNKADDLCAAVVTLMKKQ